MRSSSSAYTASRHRLASKSSVATTSYSGSTSAGTDHSDGQASFSGSFTRSSFSMGIDSDDLASGSDNDSIKETVSRSHAIYPKVSQDQGLYKPAYGVASSSRTPKSSSKSKVTNHCQNVDQSSQSAEMDWDEELGITESRQSVSKLLSGLSLNDTTAATPPPSLPARLNYGVRVSSISKKSKAAIQQTMIPSSSLPTGIRGLRVTQSVNESWDDDFLFQNDQEDSASASGSESPYESRSMASSKRMLPNDGSFAGRRVPSQQRSNATLRIEAQDDEEENWDTAFPRGDKEDRQPALKHSISSSTILRPAKTHTDAIQSALEATSDTIRTGNMERHPSKQSLIGSDELSSLRFYDKDSSWSGADTCDSETTFSTSAGSESPCGKFFKNPFSPRRPNRRSGTITSNDADGQATVRPASKNHDRNDSLTDMARPALKSMPASPQSQRITLPADTSDIYPKRSFSRAKVESKTRPTLPPVRSKTDETDSVANGPAPSMAPSAPLPSSKVLSEASRKPIARRNSVGDLRIPSQISKAQIGIKANMMLLRDFAKGIAELKALQSRYEQIAVKVLEGLQGVDRSQLELLDATFKGWWECADVLVGLGEGRSDTDSSAQVETVSRSPAPSAGILRERRITLATTPDNSFSPSFQSEDTSGSAVSRSSRSGSSTHQRRQSYGSRTSSISSRNVDPQREMNLIAAMLSGSSPISQSPPNAFQGLISARLSVDMARAAEKRPSMSSRSSSGQPPTTPDIAKASATSLSFADQPTPRCRRQQEKPAAKPNFPYHTAPASTGSRASLFGVVSSESVDITDVNRSAKRRLRSASRAGLQGLKELLKAFRSHLNEDEPSFSAKDEEPLRRNEKPATRSIFTFHSSRKSIDGASSIKEGADTSLHEKRQLTASTKRRSFTRFDLWSESSLVSHPSPEKRRSRTFRRKKDEETVPIPPVPRILNRNASLSVKKRESLSLARSPDSSLDGEWVQSEFDSPEVRGGTLGLYGKTRRPSDAATTSRKVSPSWSIVSVAGGPSRTTSTAVSQQQASLGLGHVRASTSSRSFSLTPSPSPLMDGMGVPAIKKMALEPEAISSLLVYVQATKQHLSQALSEMEVIAGNALSRIEEGPRKG